MNKLKQLDAIERFEKWMKTRDNGIFRNLKMKTYMDGEPYFESQGAEISLSQFLRREKDLTDINQ